MATTRFFLDTRRRRRDGTCHLKLMINKDSRTALVGLSVFLLPEQWDSAACRVIGRSDRVFLNTYITHRKQEVDEVLLRLIMEHRLNRYNVYELKAMVDDTFDHNGGQDDSTLLLPFFQQVERTRRARTTRRTFENAESQLRRFCGDALETLRFDDITPKWLARFDDFLQGQGLLPNTRFAYLSKLRTALNLARDDELTASDPFRKFKLRRQETRKRSLTVEQLRSIIRMPLAGQMGMARDIFLLTFYLCGINCVDLYNLRELTNGRAEYRRAKTGKLYSIKVEPEAREIIDRYRGKTKLLSVCDGYSASSSLTSFLNRNLYAIMPKVSTYWARHTWATVAASLDIPKETIAAALGHSIGSPVTSIYIRFDERKIDEANRRVIDHVLEK